MLRRILLCAALATTALAQGWNQLATPAWSQAFPDVVTDFARRRLTTVDANGTTWEWDVSRWRELGDAHATGHLVHHAGGHRTLLATTSFPTTLLAWDGHAWSTEPVPPPSGLGSLACDVARNRIVAIDVLNTVFEFDGATWTPKGIAPAANWARLVYDSGRQQMLLLSHPNLNTPLQTHAWNGAAWQLVSTTGPSNPHFACADDPVRGRVVAHGGGASNSTAGTYEWNGTQWTLVQAGGPLSRFGHTLAFDPQRGQVLAFGGNQGSGAMTSTTSVQDAWAWNGVAWQLIATMAPASRVLYGMHYDRSRDRLLLHGGRVAGVVDGALWEFDGVSWQQRPSLGGPSAREGHALAEAPGGGSLLFGGYDGQYRGDFWRWNGAAWTQLQAPGPSARAAHGMVTDYARNRVVLHGGSSAPFAPLTDTWEWDGAAWTQVATNGPSAIFGSILMTWDPIAGGALLYVYGGGTPGTWLWNGLAWSNAGAGLADQVVALGFDPARGTTLAITRGLTQGGQLDTWARTGATWTPVTGLARPVRGPFDATGAMAHDNRGRLLHHGGTFLASLPSAPAAAIDVGPPCQDPAATTPYLTSFGLPRVGDLAHRLDVGAEPLRAGAVGFATQPGLLPFGPGCDWQLDHGPELLVVTDAAGLGSLPLPLPADPRFYGLAVFVQLATIEPLAARGFTFSAPLRLQLGD